MLYAWLTPTYFVDGDNAEFATLSALGGAAHPSGYPSYVLWLRALSWLPGASVAHTAALATAILGVAACAVLHAACRAWGARPAAATFAVALFAAGPVVLRLHTEAEVFALNNLIVALVLLLAAERGPLRGAPRAIALALVAGIGLANHLTCSLVAPVGILGVIRGLNESSRPKPAVIAATLAALVVGLSPYLYLMIVPETAISWGRANDFDELIGFVTRRDYGGAVSFSPNEAPIDVVANLGALANTLMRGWLVVPLLLGLIALGARAVRPSQDGEPRRGWILLAVTWLVAGPLLIARFNVEPTELGLLVCQRFHILPLLLLTIPVAVGVDRALAWIEQRVTVRPTVANVIASLAFVAAAASSLRHHLAIDSPAVQKGTINMLRSMPPNAVVISQTDLRSGVTYAQELLKIRPDVTLITWRMMPLPWYRARLAQRGLSLDPHAETQSGPPSVRIAEQVHATGRPLFVDLFASNIVKEYTTYPHGVLLRVLPHGEKQLSLDEIIALNHDLYSKFDLDYPRPGPHDGYPTGIHSRYASTWGVIAKALSDAGRKREAHDALEIAKSLAPK